MTQAVLQKIAGKLLVPCRGVLKIYSVGGRKMRIEGAGVSKAAARDDSLSLRFHRHRPTPGPSPVPPGSLPAPCSSPFLSSAHPPQRY